MPILVTKTVRITEEQEQLLLRPRYRGRSSFLVRELLKIFTKAEYPGVEILKLRKEIEKEGM